MNWFYQCHDSKVYKGKIALSKLIWKLYHYAVLRDMFEKP